MMQQSAKWDVLVNAACANVKIVLRRAYEIEFLS